MGRNDGGPRNGHNDTKAGFYSGKAHSMMEMVINSGHSSNRGRVIVAQLTFSHGYRRSTALRSSQGFSRNRGTLLVIQGLPPAFWAGHNPWVAFATVGQVFGTKTRGSFPLVSAHQTKCFTFLFALTSMFTLCSFFPQEQVGDKTFQPAHQKQ
jgi:hypothetical protein